jgi:hypothetical protein
MYRKVLKHASKKCALFEIIELNSAEEKQRRKLKLPKRMSRHCDTMFELDRVCFCCMSQSDQGLVLGWVFTDKKALSGNTTRLNDAEYSMRLLFGVFSSSVLGLLFALVATGPYRLSAEMLNTAPRRQHVGWARLLG